VAALARAREVVLHGEVEPWRGPVVGEAPDGTVIGYGDVLRSEDDHLLTIWVPVGAEDPAVERSLFARCEDRATQLAAEAGDAAATVQCPTADDPDRVRLLEARGYRRVRTFLRMWLDQEVPDPSAAPPEGIEIVALERDAHGADVHAVLVEAFREHFSFGVPADSTTWRHDTLDYPLYVDGVSFVACRGGAVVGAIVGFPDGTHGWIRNIGVLPWERGTGLGAALLARSIRAFRELGYGEVGLGVDAENTTGATQLYERAGMRMVRQVDIYERRIPAAG
jgi:ribosomal protein S18 acetylase RimI-like enzyme